MEPPMPAAWTRRRNRNKPPHKYEPARLDLRLPVPDRGCDAPKVEKDAKKDPSKRGIAVIDFYL